MQRHSRLAVIRPDQRRTGLSLLALAVSLALAGCASHTPINSSNAMSAPTSSTIGTSTLNVADAAIASGDPNMALTVSQSILSTDPDNVDALVHEGQAYYALDRCPASVAAFQRALKDDPKSAEAQVGLGRCELKVDPASAETSFLAATQDDPGNAAAFADLGIARDMQGNHAGAASAYQQSLMLNPGSNATSVNLGLSLALSGQGPLALQYLGPLATGQGATPKIREDYAVALLASGRGDDARQVLAVDMTPDQVNRAMDGYQTLLQQSVTSAPQSMAPPPTVAQVDSAAVTATPMAGSAPVPLAPETTTTTTQSSYSPPPPVSKPAPEAASTTADKSTAAYVPDNSTAAYVPPGAPDVADATPPAPAPAPAVKKTKKSKSKMAKTTPPAEQPAEQTSSATPTAAPASTPAPTSTPAATPTAASSPASTASTPPAASNSEATVTLSPVTPANLPPDSQAAVQAATAPPGPEQTAPAPTPDTSAASSEPTTSSHAAVQIASLNSEDAAHAEWRKVSAAAPGLFAGKSPDISKVQVGSQTYYRLRVSGFSSHAAAKQFCSQITSAGGTCVPANF